MPGPAAVEVTARHVRTGDDWSATLAVTGYPAEVSPGWLEPLLSYPGRLDVTLHIEPIPVAVAAARLRRQRARLESGRRAGADRGRLDDPGTESAASDARDLAYRLARGEGKLFRLGLYLTVHAGSEEDLAAETAAVRALAASLLLVTVPATFRSLQGWATTLPAGTDQLLLRRTMDTAALAASFPFTSPDLPRDPADPSALPGVLYGANTAGPGLVAWDRWAQPNHNSVTLAASGAGKSYLAKLEILRSLYQGTECHVIDPENEYERLAAATGGAYVHLGAPGVHLNPFDLPAAGRARADTLTRRALFIHTVVAVLLGGEPSPAERAALDKAIMTAYQRAGITADARTWARPAPLLAALPAALRAAKTEAATALADRLVPYTEGSHSGLFAAPTTTRPEGHLVVFSLRDVPDELRPAATLLALDATWRTVSDPARRRRRLITVDEAWLLMKDPEGARFLYRMAKSARKAWAGLAAVTQDADDVLSSRAGPGHHQPTPPPRSCSARHPRPSRRSPPSSGCPPGSGSCCSQPAGARACWPPGRPPGSPSRPSRPRPSTSSAPVTRPRSPGCRPASEAAGAAWPARTARQTTTARRTCCHDTQPLRRPARPAGGSSRRPGRPVPDQPRRLHRAPGPAAARRPGPLRAGGRAAARRRGDRRDRGPGLAAPPAARRLRRGGPAGHGPGPAAGRPGRGGGPVGAPDRAAAPGLGPAACTGSRTWAGSTPGPAAPPPG